jgi:hypothetical protein
VLSLRRRAGRPEPRFHALDLFPEERIHIVDEVFEHEDVADRLHRDLSVLRDNARHPGDARELPAPVDPEGALTAEPAVA